MKRAKLQFPFLACGILFLILPVLPAAAEEGLSPVGKRLQERPVEILIQRLERPEHEEDLQPERVVETLGVQEGEVVADLGAGAGLFTFHLAPIVGAAGKVYAIEIKEKLLDYIRDKAERQGLRNIIVVKATPADPNLPAASCDRILNAGIYYYLADPVAYMARLRQALKPGGLVAVIDLDAGKVSERVRNRRDDLLSPDQVVQQMQRAGFELRGSYDFLTERFFLVFAAPG